MRLDALLAGVQTVFRSGGDAAEISGLSLDSRRTRPGDAFFALPGAKTDGNRFVRDALAKGAAAVLSELKPPPAPMALVAPGGRAAVWVQIADIAAAMARASANFFGDPSAAMTVVGVTGTNGKTTVTYFLESIAARAGLAPGVIGTVSHRLRHQPLEPAVNTTPLSPDLTRLLARMRDGGAAFVAMEVSSHALATRRAAEVHFDAGIFTNLQSDHLDFHKTREDYFEAKAKLFALLERADSAKARRVAVLNRDDESCARLRRRVLAVPIATFGLGDGADCTAAGAVLSLHGTIFRLRHRGREWAARVRLPGEHNLRNALAAAACALELGLAPEAVVEGLGALERVPGRLEPVEAGQAFTILVDFAHTEDALRSTLAALRALPHRRLLTVFGCGGDRDRSKRGPMGLAACRGSDLAFATTDNPRGEDPMDILREIEAGLRAGGAENYRIIPDRREAIFEALRQAQKGDIVLLAGKGHEAVQILKDRAAPFDDRAVAQEAVRELGRA